MRDLIQLDLSRASQLIQKRTVSPVEQHIHGVLEMIPFLAILIVSIMYWPAVLSLVGQGPATFAPALKRPPLPAWYLAGVLAAVIGLAVLPYAEELLRTLRWRRQAAGYHSRRGAGGTAIHVPDRL